jgi:hypothetical protein
VDELPNLVAAGARTSVSGRWQRHVAARHSTSALEGRRGYGRWGTKDGFDVLYLARPEQSVVVEAYRHLIDPIEDPDAARELLRQIEPRVLVTVDIDVTDVLDLRDTATRVQLGLTKDVLCSGTEDREAYAACQRVAQVAHQLGFSGVIAPAATKMGETLALFMDRLISGQEPVRCEEDQLWTRLPPDPRIEPSSGLTLILGDRA